MRAVTVLYAARLAPEAFEPLVGEETAFDLALERAAAFPGGEKIILLAEEGENLPLPELSIPVLTVKRPRWTAGALCAALSEAASGYDFAYYAWADSPFLDPALAENIARRHVRYAADYSFADGWPGGLGPELITAGASGILSKIAGDAGESPVKRDSIFTVLQKDINSFDIETEISSVDLRYHRLNLAAASRRDLVLLRRFAEAVSGSSGGATETVERFIAENPGGLRTLPAFFPIQVSGPCPAAFVKAGQDGGSHACGSRTICPYPRFGAQGTQDITERKDFLSLEDFTSLLDKIEAFAGDAVIDLSLWGELSLHPRREEIVRSVLERPALSLIIETSGYGWGGFGLEGCAKAATEAAPRHNGLAPLSWIVSLNPADLPGSGNEAAAFVKKLAALFPKAAGQDDTIYVEAVRISGEEDAVEQFYRAWKAYGADHPGPGIIIQKYDSFCGFLPQRQAVDLSPVDRRPCWHLMRDFPILLDGTVPVCREILDTEGPEPLGNALTEDLETIWRKGEGRYLSHCEKNYEGPCGVCDEYYTFNF